MRLAPCPDQRWLRAELDADTVRRQDTLARADRISTST